MGYLTKESVQTGARQCPIVESNLSHYPRYESTRAGQQSTNPLRDHLCRWYWGKGENLTPRQGTMTHITLYARDEYALIPERRRNEIIIGRSLRVPSVHIYDITPDRFRCELRNVPMSAALRKHFRELEATLDRGQTCVTVRLWLMAADTLKIRRLAELVRRVPKDGRIDAFGGSAYDSRMTHNALLRLARVLEAFSASCAQSAAEPARVGVAD